MTLADPEPLSQTYTFNFEVTNSPPVFTTVTTLPAQKVKLNEIVKFALPAFADPDGSAVTVSYSPTSLAFVSFVVDNTFTFDPKEDYSLVGMRTVTVTLSDDNLASTSYSFDLTVTNTAPTLTYPISDYVIAMNKLVQFSVTNVTDLEKNPIYITAYVLQTDGTYTQAPASNGFISF